MEFDLTATVRENRQILMRESNSVQEKTHAASPLAGLVAHGVFPRALSNL